MPSAVFNNLNFFETHLYPVLRLTLPKTHKTFSKMVSLKKKTPHIWHLRQHSYVFKCVIHSSPPFCLFCMPLWMCTHLCKEFIQPFCSHLGEEVALYCSKYLPDIIKEQKTYKDGKLQKVRSHAIPPLWPVLNKFDRTKVFISLCWY